MKASVVVVTLLCAVVQASGASVLVGEVFCTDDCKEEAPFGGCSPTCPSCPCCALRLAASLGPPRAGAALDPDRSVATLVVEVPDVVRPDEILHVPKSHGL